MDEKVSSNPELEDNWGDWKSWTPEYFLYVLLYELRTVTVIKGYVEILSNEKAKENHPLALERISKSIGDMENLREKIAEYLHELKAKN